MRVFKWTPEFDPFFESPIAVIWCNLVGLPIHLFEKSALFAIGSLLGTPIQVDQATISQKRLSFARLCVEIDISQTPPEEIVIVIEGRELRQKVKWEKIPQYCQVCKHVGHSLEDCYADGKKEKPAKKDYNASQAKWKQPGGKSMGETRKQDDIEGVASEPQIVPKNLVADIVADLEGSSEGSMAVGMDEDGFQMYGSRRGRSGGVRGKGSGRGLGRSFSFDRGRGGRGSFQGGLGGVQQGYIARMYGDPGPHAQKGVLVETGAPSLGSFSNPKFFKSLPNGDFDDEFYEDEKEWDPEDDQEDKEGEKLLDKREAEEVALLDQGDESSTKKGRFETPFEIQLV